MPPVALVRRLNSVSQMPPCTNAQSEWPRDIRRIGCHRARKGCAEMTHAWYSRSLNRNCAASAPQHSAVNAGSAAFSLHRRGTQVNDHTNTTALVAATAPWHTAAVQPRCINKVHAPCSQHALHLVVQHVRIPLTVHHGSLRRPHTRPGWAPHSRTAAKWEPAQLGSAAQQLSNSLQAAAVCICSACKAAPRVQVSRSISTRPKHRQPGSTVPDSGAR